MNLTFKEFMVLEARYKGNIGMMEMAKFFQVATPEEKGEAQAAHRRWQAGRGVEVPPAGNQDGARMKINQLLEAPKPQISGDAAAIVEKVGKLIKGEKPVKLPKLPREMINHAIEEAVARMNAAGTGDAHDVVFPYDTDFGINTKAQNIIGGRAKNMDIELTRSPVFKRYLLAVKDISEYGAAAEAYGKLVYQMIITLWGWLNGIHRTDDYKPSDEDVLAMKLALKGLGVNIVKPR